jgi:flagellar biosynthetic protein FlhB
VEVFVMLGPVVAGIAVVGVGANLIQTGLSSGNEDALQSGLVAHQPDGRLLTPVFRPRSISRADQILAQDTSPSAVSAISRSSRTWWSSFPLTQFGMESLLADGRDGRPFKAALTMRGAEPW